MKTYLKNLKPDEVIKRLQVGEVVKSNTYKDFEYKLVDGFIMSYNPDGYFLNPGLFISGEDLYFETPDELKLEVGKCYRTRAGKKAFVCHKINESDCFVGVVAGERCQGFLQEWDGHGNKDMDDNDLDLISEWNDNEKI